ncbi:MAG: hypothetical protein C4324_02935, partial [Blastocatellia bacterium]
GRSGDDDGSAFFLHAFIHSLAFVFTIFIALELFVVFIKWGDDPTDYDVTIEVQEDIRIKRLRPTSTELRPRLESIT